MASKGIICTTHNIEYLAFRKAQIAGAETADQIAAATGAGSDCGKCKALVANVIELGR